MRWTAACLLVMTAVPAKGQDGPAGAAAGASRSDLTIRAVRLSAPLHLDGVLDEPRYTTAAPITGFLQTEPHEGEPATERTEVWVFFD